MPRDVAMRVWGRELTAWDSVSFTRSLDEMADSFSFASGGNIGARDVPFRSRIEIVESGEIFLTGRAEVPSWRRATRTVEFRGRSVLGDVVSWDAIPGTYRNVSLLQLAEIICEPHRIAVTCDDDGGATIQLVTIEPGEKGGAIIDREARARGYLPVSEPTGLLRLMRPGMRRSHDTIRVPDVLDIELTLDGQERPGVVEVRGEQAWSDDGYGAGVQHSAEVSDATTRSARRLVITSEVPVSAEDARNRALYEMAIRLGRSVSCTVRLPSWRQSNGEPWEPGLLAPVVDEWIGIDTEMLIAAVTYTAGASEAFGAVATLRPAEAYLYGDPSLWGRTVRRSTSRVPRTAQPKIPWWEDGDPDETEAGL